MIPESTYTPKRPDCPHPEAWHTFDMWGTEVEVSEGIGGLVRMLQPRLVVETGTHLAITSTFIAQALERNGNGRLFTVEIDPTKVAHCRDILSDFECVDLVQADALTVKPPGEIDLLFVDGGDRFAELKHFLPFMSVRGIVLIHDSRRPEEKSILQWLAQGGWAVVDLPTPRGIAICRRRSA